MSLLTPLKLNGAVLEKPMVSLDPIPFDSYIDHCIMMANERLHIVKNECRRMEDNFKNINEGIRITEAKLKLPLSECDYKLENIKLTTLLAIRVSYDKSYHEELTHSFNNYVIPIMESVKRLKELKLYLTHFNTATFKSGDPSVINFPIEGLTIRDMNYSDILPTYEAFITKYTPYDNIIIKS